MIARKLCADYIKGMFDKAVIVILVFEAGFRDRLTFRCKEIFKGLRLVDQCQLCDICKSQCTKSVCQQKVVACM